MVSLLAEEPASVDNQADDGNQGGGHNLSCAKSLVRPSRVRAMLASRACRSSIMIGDALSKREMQKVKHYKTKMRTSNLNFELY